MCCLFVCACGASVDVAREVLEVLERPDVSEPARIALAAGRGCGDGDVIRWRGCRVQFLKGAADEVPARAGHVPAIL
jgi:hypothetical protein